MSMMKVVYKTLLYSQLGLYFLHDSDEGSLHQFSTHGLSDGLKLNLQLLKGPYRFFYSGVMTDGQCPNKSAVHPYNIKSVQLNF